MLTLIYYIEECLIDFCEVEGQHTGENLANVVWTSLGRYNLIGRVSLHLYVIYVLLYLL
jgi:hypothetical protein